MKSRMMAGTVIGYGGRLALAVLVLVAVSAMPAQAQERVVLTLQESVAMAARQGPSAEQARLRFAQARWEHRAFQARYLPALTLSGNAPGLTRSIADVQQDDGSVRYVEQSRTFSAVNLGIAQPVPFTGGQLSVASRLSRVQQFGSVDFREWQSSPLVVGWTQPLFQFNAMKWDRRLEPLRFEVARQQYLEDREAVSEDVVDAFFDVYLAQMNVDIATFNVAVNDTIYTLSTGRFELGTIAENDLLQSELALLNAQTARSDARIAYERAVQRFKLLLGLPYDADVDILPPTDVPALDVDPTLAVEQARRHRAAFRSLEVRALEADRNVAQARRRNGFSADLNASFGLNQAGSELDAVYGNLLNQQQFSVGFTVPLFRWGQGGAEVEATLAARDESEQALRVEREELEQNVYFEALQLRQLQQQVALAAKADTVAARRFEVARNRYLVGKIDITDLFNAQREKDSARRSFVTTLRQFWGSYARLRRLTLYDFAAGTPIRTAD